MLPALGRCLASCPIEVATSRHAIKASSTASGSAAPNRTMSFKRLACLELHSMGAVRALPALTGRCDPAGG